MHDALLQTPEGDRVRCGLCPHRCLIAEGSRGVCGARGVVDGRLVALTYGMVSSLAADPIEKKPVFHYCPGTRVLSLGSVG
ncbi:MAG: AmmeMemoRadiSam system radical SAM enzyme, partial [Deltaproteobacteria bacterium HGW-Deltaproteobacteria-20]